MLRNHPLREEIVREMLLRRFPPIEAPATLIQIVRLVDPADRAAERQVAIAMPGVTTPLVGERHAEGRAATGALMLWERHSEASTATVVDAEADERDWIEALPGEAVRAIRLDLVADDEAAAPVLAHAALVEDDLVECRIGPCRIWSDFRIGADGYGRIVVAANGCTPADLARAVQRLQELGNYRNLALLGLPLTRQYGPRLDALEADLTAHAARIAAGDGDDEALLEALCALSAELAHVSAAAGFRLSATAAYAAIAADRLAALDVAPIPGRQSLTDFNDRRLLPAVRTCASFTQRLDTLARRTDRVTALLRTRIETRIERQNRDLLGSVERGIVLQLRLQHLVESLSVLAISYYAVGLVSYLAKGAAHVWPGFSPEAAVALSVVPVTAAMFLFIHHRRSKLMARDVSGAS